MLPGNSVGQHMRKKVIADHLPILRAKLQRDLSNKKVPAAVKLKARRALVSVDRALANPHLNATKK